MQVVNYQDLTSIGTQNIHTKLFHT